MGHHIVVVCKSPHPTSHIIISYHGAPGPTSSRFRPGWDAVGSACATGWNDLGKCQGGSVDHHSAYGLLERKCFNHRFPSSKQGCRSVQKMFQSQVLSFQVTSMPSFPVPMPFTLNMPLLTFFSNLVGPFAEEPPDELLVRCLDLAGAHIAATCAFPYVDVCCRKAVLDASTDQCCWM